MRTQGPGGPSERRVRRARIAHLARFLVAPATVYLAAFALRLFGLHAPIWGDEAWHFSASRRLFDAPTNVYTMLDPVSESWDHLFWWRPMFVGLLAPAAFVSFEAWRLWHLAFTATTPLFGYFILKDLRVRPAVLWTTIALLSVQPLLFTWGVVVFPDGLMTTFVAAALWMHVRGKVFVAAPLLTAALWSKESALVVAVYLTLHALVRSLTEPGARPLWKLLGPALLYLVGTVVGLIPLLTYMGSGGQPPGWVLANDGWAPLDRLFVHVALAPLFIVGLLWKRTRMWAGLPLVLATFYLLLTFVADRHVEGWYFTLPTFAALVAGGAVADEAIRRAPKVGFRFARPAIVSLLVVLTALASTSAALPKSEWKGTITHPIAGDPDFALWEEIEWTLKRGQEEQDLVTFFEGRHEHTIALVDVGWFFALYPFSPQADEVRQAYTEWYHGTPDDAERWEELLERRANVSVVHKNGSPANRAIVDTYSNCKVFENAFYLVFEGPRCAGRAPVVQGLYAEYMRKSAAPT